MAPREGTANRRADDGWRAEVDRRLGEGDKRMSELTTEIGAARREIGENTRVTKEIKENTDQLVEVFKNLKGFNAVSKIGIRVILTIGALLVALGAIWYVIHTGNLPTEGVPEIPHK
jgi:hypothetical protein